jgi:amidase
MVAAPLLGIPGLALPIGMDGDLSMGVQLYCAPWREALLLEAAAAVERAEPRRTPIPPRA